MQSCQAPAARASAGLHRRSQLQQAPQAYSANRGPEPSTSYRPEYGRDSRSYQPQQQAQPPAYADRAPIQVQADAAVQVCWC